MKSNTALLSSLACSDVRSGVGPCAVADKEFLGKRFFEQSRAQLLAVGTRRPWMILENRRTQC